MGTIEQAAKRLQQLRQSGTDVGETVRADAQVGSEASEGSVPLRVVKELEARTRAPQGEVSVVKETDGAGAIAGAQPLSAPGSARRVEINLAMLAANGYISPESPRSPVAEQFRVIKRPLLTNARGKSAAKVANGNRIMVTSSVPSEGKTFIAVNLAMSLAMEVDSHVLLVDADTARPAVLNRLGVAATKGLLDLLVDPNLPLDSVVMSTNVDRLSILPAGNPNEHATELLASDAMSRLVERLSSADPRLTVIFDSPPLLPTSEARVLASHMGQVILVVAADDTTQATVQEALATIENCPVVMTLLNRSTATEAKHYYGYYGGGYGS